MKKLNDFRVPQPVEVFKDARVLPIFFQNNLIDEARVVKVFEDDLHANIRVFYYQYLKICFESQTSNYDFYIQKIEEIINNPDFQFVFSPYDDPTIFNDPQFKNLIIEFFEILSQASNSIDSALNIYPIMDIVFVYFFRSLLIILGKSDSLDTYLDRGNLFNFLTTYFAVQVSNHELCIKFVDTDIFVYEEDPRRVYLAYMDYGRNSDTRVIPVYRDQLLDSTEVTFQTVVDDAARHREEERQVEQATIIQLRAEEEERNRKADQERQQAQKYRIEYAQAEQERSRVEQQIKRLEQENKRAEEERTKANGRRLDPIKTESSATIPYSNRGQVKINQSYIDSEFIDYTAGKGVDLNGLLKGGMKKSTTLEGQASQAESLMYLQSDRTSPPSQSEAKAYESNLEKPSSAGYQAGYNAGENLVLSAGYNAGYNAGYSSEYKSEYNSAGFKSGVNLSTDYTNGNKVVDINTGASLNKTDSFFQSLAPKGIETKGFYTSAQTAARLSSTMQEYQRPERKSKKNHPLGLNVSDEFTDSFTKKAMCEPHRSNIVSMRARARENRASIGHFLL